ncbi:uncharacterized protein L969DRAFT_70068 [Mixia osmundae IAM 14324]|uniref:Vesicle transport protein n=1 Tax=Mixia osmundae (strain CBS 9802 / IAM 14324 / JCM 22182 / KY 12970) TaxID=764103 RepID=G7DT51_MIXOS|nr:uncharacterized protein L969DRAFT_70068 [Mixia osmundae IAM 14324]KEI42737.1 hypothetical protein L969DRAFT_70068 [Mixia osmundae IAM 14324]GAA93930.1 hypothetical protein E5Q_00576 [Mixia osmundae IAM 14324]
MDERSRLKRAFECWCGTRPDAVCQSSCVRLAASLDTLARRQTVRRELPRLGYARAILRPPSLVTHSSSAAQHLVQQPNESAAQSHTAIMWLTDLQKIGVGITSFGMLFLFLGVITFFDAALLALGDILFLSGITLVIGPRKTFAFFARRQKIRGTICFLGGIVLVFCKYPFWGMLIEAFGFLNLFGDFFPVVLTFLRQLPVIGHFLSLPYVRQVTDRLTGARQSAV